MGVPGISPNYSREIGANTQKQNQIAQTKADYDAAYKAAHVETQKPSAWPFIALAKGTYTDAKKAYDALKELIKIAKTNPNEGDKNTLNAARGAFKTPSSKESGYILTNANAGTYDYIEYKWKKDKNSFSDYSIEFKELKLTGSTLDPTELIAALSLKEHMTSKGFTRWDVLLEADPNITAVKITWKFHGKEKTQEFKKDEAIKLQFPIDAVYGDVLEMKKEESSDCKAKNKDYPYKITNSRKRTSPAYFGGKDSPPSGTSFCGNSNGEKAPDSSVKTEVFPTTTSVVDACVGSWGDWSSCSNGKQTRSYNMTSGVSSSCPDPETQTCGTACEGEWEEGDSECIDGKITKMYTIKTKAKDGGKECSNVEGDKMITDCTEDEESFWEKYKWYIIGGGSTCLCCICIFIIFIMVSSQK